MSEPQEPVFLARESYRRRRLADAARFVPLLGLVLLLLPVLWADTNKTANTIVYIFSAWALLIGVVGILSRRLSRYITDSDESTADDIAAER